jgi:alkylation response protein AidB-like acyl-CoA dehydrogenase
MMRRMKMGCTENATKAQSLRRALRARMETFARTHVASRSDWRDHEVIPADLWRAFGDAGLAGIGLPETLGGCGGDYRALAMAAEALAAVGGVKGIVSCWLSRQTIARLHILRLGDSVQRAAYVPKLASGAMTPCMAISEPGAGAHPKHLKTTATRDGDDFILNGEKAYLTNGPIADLFLVLAITGVENERKQFSVLLVPGDAPGLERTEGVKIDYLRPAPHCGLKLTDVRVPAANILGPEGDAFAAISLPMRRTEDALAAASMAGSMRHQIAQFAHEVDPGALDDDDMAELGWLAAAPDGLAAMAYHAAELLDLDPEANADEISSIAAAARDWSRVQQQRIGALMDKSGLAASSGLAAERRDLEKTLGIARTAHIIQARRRAVALIEA